MDLEPVKITTALRRFLRTLEPVSPAHDVFAAVALALAAKLDNNEAGSMTAAVARELRATLVALLPVDGDRLDGELTQLLEGLAR